MLSKAFRCLEKGEKHSDYASAEIELNSKRQKRNITIIFHQQNQIFAFLILIS